MRETSLSQGSSRDANVEELLVPVVALDGILLHQTINHMQFI